VRVLYQVWAQPLMTINGRHVITDLIERCGGVNVFADEPVLVPQIGIEAAVAAAPEAIIASAGSRSAGSDRSLEHWHRYAGIPAVARGFLFLVDGDSISRATPRMLDAGEAICGHLDKVRRSR
jgi:iron complex transport system substrate-binding protein